MSASGRITHYSQRSVAKLDLTTLQKNVNVPISIQWKLEFKLKTGIHPEYYHDAVITCSCGNTLTTGSTKKELKVEVCSSCHPFFTGEQRIVDTEGRVDRIKKRYGLK